MMSLEEACRNKPNLIIAANLFSVHCELKQIVRWFRTSYTLSVTKIAAGV